jgi:hypothetical protein
VLRHIVLLKFNDALTPDALAAIDEGLRTLPPLNPTVRSYTHGRDLRVGEGTWDYGIVADFDDADGWLAYDTNDEHNRVRRELIAPYLADRCSVRFQLEGE